MSVENGAGDTSLEDKGGAGGDTSGGDTGGNKQVDTVIDSQGENGAGNQTGVWPEDWRKRFAGEDEKELKRLERLASPEALWKANRELEKKLSSGEYRRAAPRADASPEEVAKWRKENGLPEKVEEYGLKLREGFVPSDDDKPLLEDFKRIAFESNLPIEKSSALAQWFLDKQDEMVASQLEKDYMSKSEAEEVLRTEFGGEYKPNMAMTKSFLEGTFGADVASQILLARGPDGRKIGNNPDVVKALVNLAREVMPGGNIVPAGSPETMAKSIQDELDTIRKVRREDPHKYWGDKSMQSRERELIGAQLKASQGR